MELLTFNVEDGYTEALIRGMRTGYIRKEEYDSLRDCISMQQVKMLLEETDYLPFIQTEDNLTCDVIYDKMLVKLANEFEHLISMASPGLRVFLEKSLRFYMIENVFMLLEGARRGQSRQELSSKIHPLGRFDNIESIIEFQGEVFSEIYHIVLIDSPVGEYFEKYLSTEINAQISQNRTFEEVHRQMMEINPGLLRTSMKKLWLEDLYETCRQLPPTSREILEDLLKFEADCMTIQVIYNSLNNEQLNNPIARKTDRKNLCPNFGYLYPDCDQQLEKVSNIGSLRIAVETYQIYSNLLREVADPQSVEEMRDENRPSLDDLMFELSAKKYSQAFDQQFHYAAFYAHLKLKEHESRVMWYMSRLVQQGQARENPKWRKYEKMIPFYCLTV